MAITVKDYVSFLVSKDVKENTKNWVVEFNTFGTLKGSVTFTALKDLIEKYGWFDLVSFNDKEADTVYLKV